MAKLYVIRFKDRKESQPLSELDVKELILKHEVDEDDDISIHPNQFAIKAKSYPEFELFFEDEDKTSMIDTGKKPEQVHEDRTSIFDLKKLEDHAPQEKSYSDFHESPDIDESYKKQKTMIFERPKELLGKDEKSKKSKVPKKSFLIMMLLAVIVYEMLFEDEDQPKEKPQVVMVPVRPQLPVSAGIPVDPILSEKAYHHGLKPYFEDTVSGYRKAADIFHLALKYDPQNVAALSMLASSYLNLIESSNQDEKTFSVINKLIDLSNVKQATSVEILIAEVEFLASSRRYDAAIQRLVEYSKVAGKIDPSLYYYIGWLYYLKHENSNALKYLNLIPASALPMPKLYYLRGLLHEENQEYDEAVSEYKRALHFNPKHAHSILGLVRISEKRGELKSALKFVSFLTGNPSLQSPKEYIQTLMYRSKIALLYQRVDEAISSLSQALKLDPKNEELKLEFYTLLSQSGTADPRFKKLAQMYSLVLEGEKFAREGKTHEAISVFIQAKDAFPKSEVPVEKMGDLFYHTGEYNKAAKSYKSAITLDPKAVHIVVKLIDASIKNHDWDEAQKYLAKFRSHPALKSSIDRLAGDLAAQQGNAQQAVTFYRKAMARDSIDTEVYTAYANILSSIDQCKDAQFFYTVAQKYDPFNLNAILGSAKCLLKTDNVQLAVTRIQDELLRLPKARADLTAGAAEIYLLANDDERALQFAEQAIEIDSNYPESYRIKGLVYLHKMISQKDAKKKALESLKSYSDRKPADPFGYLQRFEVFLADSNFEQAAEELNRVFEVSPRYPELHLRRAQLYSKMGRVKDALVELDEELKINGRLVKALDEKGNLLLKMNQPDEAMKSFVQAMEINPQDSVAKIGAGYVNFLKRQFPSAIALYSAALALDKGNPDIHKKLGHAYRESGDQQRAAQSFRNYLDLAPDAPDREEYEKFR
jgi:tetratricopeptide (TPR) repeat protein